MNLGVAQVAHCLVHLGVSLELPESDGGVHAGTRW